MQVPKLYGQGLSDCRRYFNGGTLYGVQDPLGYDTNTNTFGIIFWGVNDMRIAPTIVGNLYVRIGNSDTTNAIVSKTVTKQNNCVVVTIVLNYYGSTNKINAYLDQANGGVGFDAEIY